MKIRPGRAVPRGVVQAAAILYRRDAQARILRAWRPGDVVHRTDGGYVRVLAAPIPMRAETAPGTPLVADGDRLDGTEVRRPRKPTGAGSWRWMQGGREILGPPGQIEDPSAWIALDLPVERLDPLGRAPPMALAVVGARPLAQIFGVPAALERDAAIQSLVKAGALPAWQQKLIGMMAFAMMPLGRMLPSPPPAGEAPQGIGQQVGSAMARMERALASAVSGLGMGWIFEQKHLAYLDKMLAMFDAGRLEDALKWAIPLGGSATGESLPAWFPGGPRTGFELSRPGGAAGRGLGLSAAAYAALRDVYRRAIAKLIEQGRIDLAAFALAELLGEVDEALALLEKHEMFAMAAEFAERKDLDAPRVIRLWFLAGEHARAVAIARRRGCWPDALARAKEGPERRALAAMWAADLVGRGELPEAVEVAWKHDLRDASRPWIRALLDTDVAGLELPRWSALGEAEDALDRLDDVVATDPGRALRLWERQDTWPDHDGRPSLAGAALRHALADGVDVATTGWLLTLAADPVLGEDVRRLTRSPAATAWPARVVAAQGPAHILDIAPCGDGLLLAHGEAGVTWLRRDGRVGWRIDAPADRLVAGPSGTALALATRGKWNAIQRIELYARTARRWVDLELTHHADRFDGGSWMVAMEEEILALDPTAPDARHHWRVDRLGPIAELHVADGKLKAKAGGELFTWKLPELRLLERVAAPAIPARHAADVVGGWTLERRATGMGLNGPHTVELAIREAATAPIRGRLTAEAAWVAGGGGVGRLDLKTGAWWTVAV